MAGRFRLDLAGVEAGGGRAVQTVRRKLALAAVAAAPLIYFVVETAPRITRG